MDSLKFINRHYCSIGGRGDPYIGTPKCGLPEVHKQTVLQYWGRGTLTLEPLNVGLPEVHKQTLLQCGGEGGTLTVEPLNVDSLKCINRQYCSIGRGGHSGTPKCGTP